MTTLFDAVLATYRELGTLKEGVVTAQGSDTDKIFYDEHRPEPDAYFKAYECGVFITKTTDGAAPQGEYQRLSAYDEDSTNQITVESNFTAAVEAGDSYAITLPKYPLQMVTNAVNTILGTLDVPHEDVSLTTVSGQTEYDIPTTVPKWGLRRVEIEQDKDDSDNQRFAEVHNCTVFHKGAGTANKLALPRDYAAGYTIKLIYVDSHDYLYAYDGSVNEHIPYKKLAAVVAPHVMRMKMEQYPSGDKTVGGRLQLMMERANKISLQGYIPLPPKSGKLIITRIGR